MVRVRLTVRVSVSSRNGLEFLLGLVLGYVWG